MPVYLGCHEIENDEKYGRMAFIQDAARSGKLAFFNGATSERSTESVVSGKGETQRRPCPYHADLLLYPTKYPRHSLGERNQRTTYPALLWNCAFLRGICWESFHTPPFLACLCERSDAFQQIKGSGLFPTFPLAESKVDYLDERQIQDFASYGPRFVP